MKASATVILTAVFILSLCLVSCTDRGKDKIMETAEFTETKYHESLPHGIPTEMSLSAAER